MSSVRSSRDSKSRLSLSNKDSCVPCHSPIPGSPAFKKVSTIKRADNKSEATKGWFDERMQIAILSKKTSNTRN
ncbi:hypothetical protein TNCV_2261021 [Trichonephila clavipes]|nr:hypothetical protein TNCV_2261021 [Trichonephila clavipes]